MSDALSHAPRERGHEVADISGRRIAVMAVGLLAVLALVALAAWAAQSLLRPARMSTQQPVPPAIGSGPRLQSAPALDLDALRREKNALLSDYGWIDQSHGVVRIPIERAMELVVQRARRRVADKLEEQPR